jgi:hypothetical protein
VTFAARRHVLFSLVFLAVVLLGGAKPAAASPQILGIVASNGQPTPLICDSSRNCRARFSAFCLQQERPAPSQGTAYRLADGGQLTMVARYPDGRVERVPVGHRVRFESRFGFTSVEVLLPADLGRAFAMADLALEVGPAVTLLPVETADDPDPQSPDEIAIATGPLRATAALLFDQPGPLADAARLTTEAINALPPQSETPPDLDRLWANTVAAGKAAGASDAGIAQASNMWRSCELEVLSRSRLSMRECLELRHTDLMARTNRQFWEQTGGS